MAAASDSSEQLQHVLADAVDAVRADITRRPDRATAVVAPGSSTALSSALVRLEAAVVILARPEARCLPMSRR
jgi:hypothetical protein